MFVSIAVTAAILSSIASAAPASDFTPRNTGASCTYVQTSQYGLDGSPSAYAYTVTIPDDIKYDPAAGHCGDGFFDNFGECNTVSSQGCTRGGGHATLTFTAGSNCAPAFVTDGVKAASYGDFPDVVCSGPQFIPSK